MNKFIELISDLNLVSTAVRLLLALILGGAIGFERGWRGRAAGFRTHILVCIGACMAALTGLYVTEVLGYQTDPTRIAAQVISGIGFLGVGTILVTGNMQVKGLTTAAGLWSTAAVGICVGVGYYPAAIMATVLLVFVIVLLHKLDNVFFAHSSDLDVYFEVRGAENINETVGKIKALGYRIGDMDICSAKSGAENSVGIEMTVKTVGKKNKESLICEIQVIESVAFAIQKD